MHEQGNAGVMATRLKYAMSLREISAAELSRRAECHKSSISMYLQGEHAASRQSAERLSRILDVNPAWLMGYDVPMRDEAVREPEVRLIDVSQRRFLQVGNTMVNLSHVVTITSLDGGKAVVLLDTGSTVEGTIVEE